MLDDLKFAWRRLRQAPGFSLAAIATLALAIGANTAIFSIADAVLFRPLPYSEPERVHILLMRNRGGAASARIGFEYLHSIDDQHNGLTNVALFENAATLIVETAQGAERVPTVAVTPNYFDVLGARPARGRLLGPVDATGGGRAAVLTHAAWQQRFGGDEQIVGRTVTLGNSRFDVVGVLRADFVFPSPMAGRPELVTLREPLRADVTGQTFYPIVRREPGVTREQAQSELDALIASLPARDPDTERGHVVLDDVRTVLYPTGQPLMKFLLAAAGLVLLAGCANLANLFLARGQRRQLELGVRSALGASRMRVVRPLVFEALLIGIAGAAVSTAAAALTFDALLTEVPRLAYGRAPVGVSSRVMAFALALGVGGAFVFSVVPAWRAARLDVQAVIQRRSPGGGRRRPLGRPMLAAQVAFAIVLLFGAMIAGRALVSVLRVPLGFSADRVVRIDAAPAGVRGSALLAFYVRALEALVGRGDAVSAGASHALPLSGTAPFARVRVPGATQPVAATVHVLPGYFETTGIRLIRGRTVNIADVQGGGVAAIVSESAARGLVGDREPLGATFTDETGRTFTVVGVVSDVVSSFDRPGLPLAYVIPKEAGTRLTLVVRTRTRTDALLADIKREIGALAPGTPVNAAWWENEISSVAAYRTPRFQTLVLGSFAALALGLAALGVFGIVAFLVASRTHEMGVRAAIGASPASLIALMAKQTIVPVAAGLVLGLAGTRGVSRLAEAQLVNVKTQDPLMLAAAAGTVILTSVVAAYWPARRAGRVDPAVVLRAV